MGMYNPNNIIIGAALLFLVAYSFFIIRRMYKRRISVLETQNSHLKNKIEEIESLMRNESDIFPNVNGNNTVIFGIPNTFNMSSESKTEIDLSNFEDVTNSVDEIAEDITDVLNQSQTSGDLENNLNYEEKVELDSDCDTFVDDGSTDESLIDNSLDDDESTNDESTNDESTNIEQMKSAETIENDSENKKENKMSEEDINSMTVSELRE